MAKRQKLSMPLWPIRNRCGDPFGPGVLDEISALEGLALICEAKQEGLIDYWSAHDDDIYPWNSDNTNDYLDPKNPIHMHLQQMKEKADAVGLKMNIITCNLHGHPLFANGGFTNPDPAKRLLAAKKALRTAWIGNFFGAQGVTYWVARDGFEVAAAVPFKGLHPGSPKEGPYQWLIQSLDRISAVCRLKNYSIKFGTIEPKGNEPRGVPYIPLVGSALALINLLDDPNFWGVNPEIPQHSAMCNQEPLLEIVQAVENEALPFLHLGNQIDGQFDNDFPPLFGPTNLKRTVQIFLYLAEVGWEGVVEFDCHVLRSDTAPGTKNSLSIRSKFISDCVEMYRMVEQILVPRIMADSRLEEARAQIWMPAHLGFDTVDSYETMLSDIPTPENIKEIEGAEVDIQAALEYPACCGDADKAFMLALFGVSDEELNTAVKGEAD